MIYNGINKPLLGIKLNRTHRLSKDLVGCWLFNEGCGNKAYDASGYGNHGTLHDMAFPATATSGWNPGRKGVGLRFDGTDDYINCGNDSSLDITSAITISAWVKVNNINTQKTIISKGDIGNVNKGTYEFRLDESGKIYFGVVDTNVYARSDTSYVADIWYHLVVINENRNVNFYINGSLDCTKTLTADPVSSSDDAIIGNIIFNGVVQYDPFNGSIDGVRIYNRALSASEISQMYRTPFCMYEIDDSWVLQAGKLKPPTGANIVAAKLLL